MGARRQLDAAPRGRRRRAVRGSPMARIRLFLTMTRHRETPTRLPRVVERVLTERAKHSGGSSEGE